MKFEECVDIHVGSMFKGDPDRISKVQDLRYHEAKRILKLCPFTAESTVLDFGCGFGWISTHIAPKIKKLYCYDTNPAMVKFCRDTMTNHNNVRVLEHTDDVFSLHVDDIIAVNVMGENFTIEPFSNLLKQLYTMLPIGGRLWFDFYDKGFIEQNLSVNSYSQQQVKDIIDDIGFNIKFIQKQVQGPKVLVQK